MPPLRPNIQRRAEARCLLVFNYQPNKARKSTSQNILSLMRYHRVHARSICFDDISQWSNSQTKANFVAQSAHQSVVKFYLEHFAASSILRLSRLNLKLHSTSSLPYIHSQLLRLYATVCSPQNPRCAHSNHECSVPATSSRVAYHYGSAGLLHNS